MNITNALPAIPPAPMPASDGVGRENLQRTAIQAPSSSSQLGSSTDAPNGRSSPENASPNDTKTAVNAESKEESRKDGRRAEDKRESERTPQEQRNIEQQVTELKNRDAEVRTHEQAHAAVGGQYAGSPSYEYQRGPNGKSYAVGGEVRIDVSVVPGDPQATIQKMQVVRRAALAPAQPSSADRAIAAEASIKAAEARAELATANAPGSDGKGEDDAKNEENTQTTTSENVVQGPVRKSLEGGNSDLAVTTSNGADTQRKALSAAERGVMIADFYSRRVSPSETVFNATA